MTPNEKFESLRNKPANAMQGNDIVFLINHQLQAILREAVRAELGKLVSSGVNYGTNFPQGAHVNSGPTGHANVPGHADFTRQGQFGQIVNPGAFAQGAHVNSGPTGHANVPGHADFTRQGQFGQVVNPGAFAQGAHVNSGPTGHANVPGHADFTKVGNLGSQVMNQAGLVNRAVNMTLNDGTTLSIPANGPAEINIKGMKIRR